MEILEIGYSSNGNTSLKNNRNLKSRNGFFKSFKDSKYKYNLQKHEHNLKIKKMDEYDFELLKLRLKREQKIKTISFVLGIVLIIITTLVLLYK